MKKISRNMLLSFDEWARVRDILRPLFIREKERRRLHAGSHLTFLFENTQTLWYQVEEIIRTERLIQDDAIQHEIDTYNELIPGPGELSATMLIEFPDAKERDAALRRLLGLERHVWLRLGARRVAVGFDERQRSTDQISSVQFVRMAAGVAPQEFLKSAQAGEAALQIDHPNLAAHAPIDGALAAALAEDLGAD
jgi:uncharacterized protein DUF3501